MIRFMRFTWLYFLISGLVIIPGFISLTLYGLRPSIDFTGGTELQVLVEPKDGQAVSEDEIRKGFGESLDISEIRIVDKSILLKAKPIDTTKKDAAMEKLRQSFAEVKETRFETVGPVLGRELLVKTLIAMLLSASGITLYVAYRFSELKYGVCAVLAMFHDSLVLFGVFSLLGHFMHVEVDVLFVTAVLTILSFSVHDTIVVYDRIRELRRRNTGKPYIDLVDTAVTETMSRSINNSMTIIFMLFVLWLFGGNTIQWFVFALLVGTVTGTYSSTFTAAPLLVVWDAFVRKRRK
ncbi:MAG: protein translocase subunit SecF [Candidatus Pacebacteria bacterium]|nr:protein translocase subunit SecF [Candidatus Paceibacterota bacterium]